MLLGKKKKKRMSQECTLKPMMAKPRLIAKAFSHHAGCAAFAIKKVSELLLLNHFCTRANDNKCLIK
jgi:hypothetical protein